MSAATTPKLKFNDFLDQSMMDRAGGKEQYNKIKSVWEGIKLKWTQAGYLSGAPPVEERLKAMQRELQEDVGKATASETERNIAHLFQKKGTREKERAEAELKVGTWAIEECRRVQPKKQTRHDVRGYCGVGGC